MSKKTEKQLQLVCNFNISGRKMPFAELPPKTAFLVEKPQMTVCYKTDCGGATLMTHPQVAVGIDGDAAVMPVFLESESCGIFLTDTGLGGFC